VEVLHQAEIVDGREVLTDVLSHKLEDLSVNK
jgi:hypothetical protein